MIKGEGNGHCRQKKVFINRHKVKAGQYKSEATTFSKLLELNCHAKSGKRSHRRESRCKSLALIL